MLVSFGGLFCVSLSRSVLLLCAIAWLNDAPAFPTPPKESEREKTRTRRDSFVLNVQFWQLCNCNRARIYMYIVKSGYFGFNIYVFVCDGLVFVQISMKHHSKKLFFLLVLLCLSSIFSSTNKAKLTILRTNGMATIQI